MRMHAKRSDIENKWCSSIENEKKSDGEDDDNDNDNSNNNTAAYAPIWTFQTNLSRVECAKCAAKIGCMNHNMYMQSVL